jgi:choline transport protein
VFLSLPEALHSLIHVSTWIALAGSIGIVIPSGGPVAFLYGFIFCVLCNLCLAASLGELSSIWPTAGGQYHYAVAVSSEPWKKTMVRCFEELYDL